MTRAGLLIILGLVSAAVAGDGPKGPEGLVYLGLNEQGAEEWYRVRDAATMIRIPGGEYLRRPYEGTVAVEEPKPLNVDAFYIDKYEVTNAQFARFLNAQEDITGLLDAGVPGLVRSGDGWQVVRGLERHPVTAATGRGAFEFARWVDGTLPLPPQWEKAAGGVEGKLYPWGADKPDAGRANFANPKARGTHPVGSHEAGASPYGCHDMAGNVYERVFMRTRDGRTLPIMLKGGSWLSAHPLNLRVLDMCVQGMRRPDRSVGFRCVLADPDPKRPVAKRSAAKPELRLVARFDKAVAEARKRRVPLFLSLLHDTCGQCDRTREQCYRDPRFIAYCNRNLVVCIGHDPSHAQDDPHPENEDGSCPLYPGITCDDHFIAFRAAIRVVGGFNSSPGNFVLHPDHCAKGAGPKAVLVGEKELPKWGNAVDEYIAAFERARAAMAAEDG